MKFKVLGCYGARLPGQGTSSFLVNDNLLVDAGTVTWLLSLEEQMRIDDILLTHAHLDHIVDLAFIADNVLPFREEPIRVWAPAEVLDSAHRHMFNNVLWPDFTSIKVGKEPILKFCPLEEGKTTQISGINVSWQPTNHTVYTAGYLLEDDGRSLLLSGDTGPTEAIWQLGHDASGLQAALAEVSFPNRLEELALISGHLTPRLLAKELVKLDRPDVPVWIFHMKPQFLDELIAELNELHGFELKLLRGNEELNI
ncbi:MAG: MBL fold metallo-hydrolase [Desulfuromonas sp.]|nr:MAG: MBL fold metallo-hydrolase [Desulfuromonas sp.]